LDCQSDRPFRGVGCEVVESCSAVARPDFRETLAPVQRFSGESIGLYSARPIPVRPSPFPAGSFGCSLSTVATEFDPGCCSSLRVTCLLEVAIYLSTAPGSANRVHLSGGSVPLQRSTALGARVTPDVPPSGTFRPQGFTPSRRLASPKTMRGLFHPRCAPGVPPDPAARQYLSVPAGPTLPGLLSKALSPPATAASPAASSHALRRSRPPGSRKPF